ncbi:NFAT activation molecule 1 [Halichoeres trimaculatus]|uniref:NFAT activation molecule 1 n=1 Tax=Halichoeres trimaculatus TaxID=147232 RepID=UPI003D9E3A24
MGLYKFLHLLTNLTCVFHSFFPSVCSGQDAPMIHLESTVFVAFRGEHLNIQAQLKIPANQSQGILKCFDPPGKQIFSCDIRATGPQLEVMHQELNLKNLTIPGEYYCQYSTAKVYWFIQLRDEGYIELTSWDPTECIVATFTALLLVFSVGGSVYVFRGNWKEHITNCGDLSRKLEQNTEEREEQENNVDYVSDPSTSFYASLDHRPRSIYDVLDHSAAKGEPEQRKAKTKKKELKERMEQTTQNQHEGVFESVYENF